jgi:polyisoprenyl-teichoic acid--peptidoglycan teichoic acid transferase
VRRRAFVGLVAAAAWIAGSTLGLTAPAERAAAQPFLELGKVHAGFVPTLNGSKPIFILFIGSGARQGESITHSLADSIHIVAINPAKRMATVVGIPRDSWVPIPGHGTNKINSAMFYGGPALLVKTVEDLTHIKLDYWALTTFWGFTSMIDGLGGLTIDVPFSMHDTFSGANFEPGVHRFKGPQALAFARDRHSLPEGDFGRSEDAGRLILAALSQFRKEFRKDPSRLFTWIGAGLRNVETEVPVDEVLALAFTCSAIPPGRVVNLVVPGSTGTAGSQSIVNLSSKAGTIFADLKKDGIVSRGNIPPSPNASIVGR